MQFNLTRRLQSLLIPRTAWVQVEVTTACNAACRYCPRTAYKEVWENRLLPLATFHRLRPALQKSRLAYLQGWGEPFLHPDFLEMLSLAKSWGCRVGTTTNGMVLDEEKIEQLVDLGLDVIAFSLAGIGEANDAIRRGTRAAKVLEVLATFKRLKASKGEARPEIHIAYMLLRSGLADLERLPGALAGLGVAQVVISTLDLVCHRELEGESWKNAGPTEQAELAVRLQELSAAARRQGLEIHYEPPSAGRRLLCPENVQSSLVVAADGAVAPCVFANLPVSRATYWSHGVEQPFCPLYFGNLQEDTLEAIWRRRAYKNFRRSFFTGVLYNPCRSCLRLE